ncbi:MFS transporter [uncultured Cytophaga sp.]|uniref:MFS transporter n=1 Tax=uncultured Cytophaga sp. TaxID=160238 RepID=UPI00260F5EBF|nr:MFS transporter [uncultured Cytophaga sp.]
MAVLFFMWGLLTNLNLFLYHHFKFIFELNYSVATFINLTFFCTYLVVSLQAGRMIKKIGYKKGILVGWLLACAGCFLFLLAVSYKLYYVFLGALFCMAAGITILQVGANLYVVLLGGVEKAASRLVFVQAFNSLGAVVGPIISMALLGHYIDLPIEYLETLPLVDKVLIEAAYINYLYLFFGILMVLFAIFLMLTYLPELNTQNLEPLNKVTSKRRRHVLHFSQLRLGAFAIFAYVGAEVSLANYLEDFAPLMVSTYWELAMVGRFVGALLLLYVPTNKALGVAGAISTALICVAILMPKEHIEMNYYLIMSVGLFNSIMFPSIFTLGVNGLGKFSLDGSAVLIMFIVGGAVLPFNVRNFAYANYDFALLIVIICYLYISVYGFKLSRYVKRKDLRDDEMLA